MIVTGKITTVREFIRMVFEYAGIKLEFKSEGVNEKVFVISYSNLEYQVKINKEVVVAGLKYFRPTEVDLLLGNPTKVEKK